MNCNLLKRTQDKDAEAHIVIISEGTAKKWKPTIFENS